MECIVQGGHSNTRLVLSQLFVLLLFCLKEEWLPCLETFQATTHCEII